MDVQSFIDRWTGREGGAERANYALFLTELCDLLGVPCPTPSGAETQLNDYVFERAVRPRASEGGGAPKRIDLYKKGAFILEAKQSRLPGSKNALPGQMSLLADDPKDLGRASAARGWDVMMQNARRQAEGYVFLLDANHPAPPFLIICDVGHCFEIYADFTGTGRAYTQFPDRKGFRIYLEDLRRPEIRERLEQPLAVEALLLAEGRPMEAAAIARAFKGGGRRIEQRVAQVLTTLARYGHITALPDGRYLARRAA